MSITINFKGAVVREVIVSCTCCGEHDKDCPICKGSGLELMNELEMNVSNGNFYHIASCLGLTVDQDNYKPFYPLQILNGAKRYIPGLGVRAEVQEGNVIMCGVDEGYMTRRISKLVEIAQAYIDAGKGDEPIHWG
jgi:hypothetical protein